METDTLAKLIESRHGLLMQLRELSRHQMPMIAEGRLQELFPLLGAKQGLLERLAEVDRGLGPFRDQDPASRRWPSESQRQACAARWSDCQVVLAEIVSNEKEGERLLQIARQKAADELRLMTSSRQARQAYAGSLPAPSASFDLTSQ